MDISNVHNVCGFFLNYRLVSFLVRKLLDWQEIGPLEPLSKTTAPSKGEVVNDGCIRDNSKWQSHGSFFSNESAAACISHLNEPALF
jgi:hypothetical protein